MTTEHPYAEVLRWIADGKAVQWKQSPGRWIDQDAESTLHEIADSLYNLGRYRLKPHSVNHRCRVALFCADGDSWVELLLSEGDATRAELYPRFVRWLTDWIEYEVDQ